MPSTKQSYHAFIERIREKLIGEKQTTEGDYCLLLIHHDFLLYLYEHPGEIDRFLELEPAALSYKGKYCQVYKRQFPQSLDRLLETAIFYHGFPALDSPAFESETVPFLKKLADFSFQHVTQKPATSIYQSQIRAIYWRILVHISEFIQLTEVEQCAIRVTQSPDAYKEDEWHGAFNYLMGCSNFEGTDPMITEVLHRIRQNPPSDSILFQLLDAEVSARTITEMAAMDELDTFRDANP